MPFCLVVDDSGVVRKIMRKICEALGYECAEAENGQVALDSCRARMPDLAMVDWNMPVMSGVDFLRALRKEPNGSDVVVILCTTNNEIALIQEALEAGANEYIMKPFDETIVRGKLSLLGLLPDDAAAGDFNG